MPVARAQTPVGVLHDDDVQRVAGLLAAVAGGGHRGRAVAAQLDLGAAGRGAATQALARHPPILIFGRRVAKPSHGSRGPGTSRIVPCDRAAYHAALYHRRGSHGPSAGRVFSAGFPGELRGRCSFRGSCGCVRHGGR
eukprot:scaffold12231_cov103-Isochrysis_galbana.AAC.3